MSVPSDSISAGGTLAINRLPFDVGAEHASYPASAFPSCGHAFPLAYRRCVPCMDGARSAREKNLTFRETIRVQPCIRPLNAAVWAGVPDVVHREAPRKYA